MDLESMESGTWEPTDVSFDLDADLHSFATRRDGVFSDLAPDLSLLSGDFAPSLNTEQCLASEIGNKAFEPQIPNGQFSTGSPYLPRELRFLLHHYDSHVVDSLSVIPLAHEAPWRRLHLASALRAYSELDVLQKSGFARVSLLYSLLSMTCFHLTSMYAHASEDMPLHPAEGQVAAVSMANARQWQEKGQRFRGIARIAFQKQLKAEEFSGKNYKELLMAALTLVCVGIVAGDSWDARLYIRHCQSIIRRGRQTKRRFSGKALKLHRMFTFVEIMEHSTFCHSRDVYVDVLKSNNTSASDLTLIKAELPDEQAGVGILATIESLEAPIMPQATVSENAELLELYGTPEKLLLLLNSTTNLIRKIDAYCAVFDGSRLIIPDSLQNEAAALENSICASTAEWESFLEPCPFIGDDDDMLAFGEAGYSVETNNKSEAAGVIAKYMRMALQHALLVYFFREVRRTHPQVLQHYVRKVVACLERHQSAKARFFPFQKVGTIVWPSFIVACEALDMDLRGRAVRCIRHAGTVGFRNGETAEAVAREVWARRDAGELTLSWRDVTRSQKVFMLLT
jgi:arginine metabolism regulation protein II